MQHEQLLPGLGLAPSFGTERACMVFVFFNLLHEHSSIARGQCHSGMNAGNHCNVILCGIMGKVATFLPNKPALSLEAH